MSPRQENPPVTSTSTSIIEWPFVPFVPFLPFVTLVPFVPFVSCVSCKACVSCVSSMSLVPFVPFVPVLFISLILFNRLKVLCKVTHRLHDRFSKKLSVDNGRKTKKK